jgi:hypothetical protein
MERGNAKQDLWPLDYGAYRYTHTLHVLPKSLRAKSPKRAEVEQYSLEGEVIVLK